MATSTDVQVLVNKVDTLVTLVSQMAAKIDTFSGVTENASDDLATIASENAKLDIAIALAQTKVG